MLTSSCKVFHHPHGWSMFDMENIVGATFSAVWILLLSLRVVRIGGVLPGIIFCFGFFYLIWRMKGLDLWEYGLLNCVLSRLFGFTIFVAEQVTGRSNCHRILPCLYIPHRKDNKRYFVLSTTILVLFSFHDVAIRAQYFLFVFE